MLDQRFVFAGARWVDLCQGRTDTWYLGTMSARVQSASRETGTHAMAWQHTNSDVHNVRAVSARVQSASRETGHMPWHGSTRTPDGHDVRTMSAPVWSWRRQQFLIIQLLSNGIFQRWVTSGHLPMTVTLVLTQHWVTDSLVSKVIIFKQCQWHVSGIVCLEPKRLSLSRK